MTRSIYIASLLLLGFLAVWRYLGNYLIEEESLKISFISQLPVYMVIAVIIGSIYFFLFKKMFFKAWQKRTGAGQFAIVVVFYLLAFGVVRQSTVSLNILLPHKKRVLYEGVVKDKRIETTQKGTKFYYFKIKDLDADSLKGVTVSKKIYDMYRNGDTLRKHLFTGPFNIKYMK